MPHIECWHNVTQQQEPTTLAATLCIPGNITYSINHLLLLKYWEPADQLGNPAAANSRLLEYSTPPFRRWFVGGRTNLWYNAVDRHLAERGDQLAWWCVGDVKCLLASLRFIIWLVFMILILQHQVVPIIHARIYNISLHYQKSQMNWLYIATCVFQKCGLAKDLFYLSVCIRVTKYNLWKRIVTIVLALHVLLTW